MTLPSEIEWIEISNGHGLSATILSYGATLQSVHFPDREGHPIDVVLGFETVEEYLKDGASFGRTIGRVTNRIKHAQFVLDEKSFQLEMNRPPHHLHGGSRGAGNRNWEVECREGNSATLSLCLRSHEDKYPGDVDIKVTYTVNDLNQLLIEFSAKATEKTVVNLTNHAYWNLDGEASSVLDHKLHIAAKNYLPVDSTSLPTGEIVGVAGTPFDFSSLRSLRNDNSPSFHHIDNDFVLDKHAAGKPLLTLESPKSGIRLELSTSYPIIHVYSASHLTGQLKGKNGKFYDAHSALAIEPQKYSDAPNNSHFPSIELRASEMYSEEIVYSFCHLN